MKFLFACLTICVFFTNTACAQDYKVDYNFNDGYTLVYKTGTEKLYGVINKDKKIVVPLEYKAIRSTGETGIFEIKDKSSSAGLYSASLQKVLLEPQFFEIENFSEGLAVVKKRRPDHGFSWGATDVKGKLVIPAEYDYLGPLSEGLINFKKDDKFGFLDKTNKVVIPAMYFDFATFSDGLAPAQTLPDGKYGFIDKNNNLVIPAEYEDANPFYAGYASVAKKKGYSMGGSGKQTVKVPGEYVLINKTGKIIQAKTFERISFKNAGGLFIIELNGKKGVMDSTGQPILPIGYEQVDIDKNGFIIFKLDGKYGMMGSRGASILQPKYDLVSHTNYNRYYTKLKGMYAVGDINGNNFIPADSANGVLLGKKRIVYYYTNRVKVFDLNGNLQKTLTDLSLRNYGHSLSVTEDSIKLNTDVVVQLINLANSSKKTFPFGEAGDFSEEGIFLGKRSNLYDFYDHTGKKLSTESYYTVVNFSDGIAAVQASSTSTPYLVDKNFKKIKDLSLNFKGPYSEGLAFASGQVGTVYYLDKQANEVFNVKAKEGSKSVGGFILLKNNNNRYYFVNKKGTPINTKTWEEANTFSEGLALVKDNGKWGFIDTLGNTVIDLKYELAGSFTKGAAIVKQHNKFFLVNKKGVAVNSTTYENAGTPGNGTFPVQNNNLVGLIDSKGNTIIDFKYINVLYMSEDRVWAAKDGKWGLLDNKGKALTEFIYQGAYVFDNGYAKFMLNDQFGLINKAGKIILPAEYKSMGSVYKGNIVAIRPAEIIVYSLK